jgi:hypothetical protein
MTTTKADLLAEITAGRARLEEILVGIPTEKMEQVVLYDTWSIKDYLAHLGFWEKSIVSLFGILRAGKTPEPFPSLDEVNARAFEESRALSLEDVLEQEKTAYQSILFLAQNAQDDELFNPDCFAWTERRAFAQFIADNTFGHYKGHMPDLLEAAGRLTE